MDGTHILFAHNDKPKYTILACRISHQEHVEHMRLPYGRLTQNIKRVISKWFYHSLYDSSQPFDKDLADHWLGQLTVPSISSANADLVDKEFTPEEDLSYLY